MPNKIVSQTSDSKGSPSGSSVQHQLIRMFWTLGPAFTRWAESHMHEQGLTAQRMRLMGLLLENGEMMMSKLRNELGVTATNVTALVDALEKEGMVARKPHPSDRRATLIAIAPGIEQDLRKHCSDFKDKVADIFSGFSAQQQKQLLSLLTLMREALVERNFLAHDDCLPKTTPAKDTL